MTDLPLPYGWIREIDPAHNHPYYVDTKANPPRSIWVHPYEDEQYLSEHPDVREKVGKASADLRPPADDQRRHSYSGEGNQKVSEIAGSSSNPGLNDKEKKRGLLAKLKDKAIGTKEEREAERRHEAEIRRLRQSQRQQELAALQQQRQQYYTQQQMYNPPQNNQYGRGNRMGGGMGGMGVPLLGGLAGGLLLGSLFDGGDYGGDGGGFGGDGGGFGGDGGGGDFGGF